MKTWQLWRAIRNPPVGHPIYRRTLRAPSEMKALNWILPSMNVFLCCATWGWVAQGSAFTAILSILFLLFLNGTFYVIFWVSDISATIAHEQELQRYDLLRLPPAGALGSLWVLCTASLERNDLYAWVTLVRAILMTVALAVLLIIVILVIVAPTRPRLDILMVTISTLVGLIAAAYIDYMQSVVQGCLIGMLSPTFVRQRVDARFWSVGGFLLLQAATYGSIGLFGFVLLPAIYAGLHFDGPAADISLTLFRLAGFYIIRESLITLMLRSLTQRLNADTGEWATVMQAAS